MWFCLNLGLVMCLFWILWSVVSGLIMVLMESFVYSVFRILFWYCIGGRVLFNVVIVLVSCGIICERLVKVWGDGLFIFGVLICVVLMLVYLIWKLLFDVFIFNVLWLVVVRSNG